MLVACGDDDDPGRNDATSSDGTATAQPTSFTATLTDSGSSSGDDGTGSTSTGDDGGSGSLLCPSTHRCIAEPPTDWNGPVTRGEAPTTSAVQAECSGDYAKAEVEAFADLDAAPASCSCECGPAVDAACETSATARFWGNEPMCDAGSATTVTIFASLCNVLGTTFTQDSYWSVDPVETQGGSCEAFSEVTMDDPTFETRTQVCGGAELLAGCAEGSICAPLAGEDALPGLCVWREGDHECPSTFPERELLHQGHMDQRGCQACTCGEAAGLCDSARVGLFFNGCVNPVGIFGANGECLQQGGQPATHANFVRGDPTAFCAPSAGSPTGAAVEIEPVTICCDA